MKNIHLIPTDKPTGLFESQSGVLHYSIMNKVRTGLLKGYHIYITSDEDIKDVRPHKGKWQLEKGQILNKFPNYLTDLSDCKLVIMTTDPDLIANGVQDIDDEFLEWFVKNPSCEEVETEISSTWWNSGGKKDYYKIIIPQEEPKLINNCPKCGMDLVEREEPKQERICNCGLKESEHNVRHPFIPRQETLKEVAKSYSERHQDVSGTLGKYLVSAVFQDGAEWMSERMYSEEDMLDFAEYCLNNVDAFVTPEHLIEQFKKKNYE